jgi:hypothetical protein
MSIWTDLVKHVQKLGGSDEAFMHLTRIEAHGVLRKIAETIVTSYQASRGVIKLRVNYFQTWDQMYRLHEGSDPRFTSLRFPITNRPKERVREFELQRLSWQGPPQQLIDQAKEYGLPLLNVEHVLAYTDKVAHLPALVLESPVGFLVDWEDDEGRKVIPVIWYEGEDRLPTLHLEHGEIGPCRMFALCKPE